MWNRYSNCFCCICVITIYIGTFIIIVSCSLSFTWSPWPIPGSGGLVTLFCDVTVVDDGYTRQEQMSKSLAIMYKMRKEGGEVVLHSQSHNFTTVR